MAQEGAGLAGIEEAVSRGALPAALRAAEEAVEAEASGARAHRAWLRAELGDLEGAVADAEAVDEAHP
ncbi:MAG TPA: hypothetical protein RMG45_13550, partial [Polyangiaceae bacterium LLY-WYZ-15_(1-7)]|nr:hypothetical protein [Polyangiaceae bacterium LLY-WYZ-15_(1-7)]